MTLESVARDWLAFHEKELERLAGLKFTSEMVLTRVAARLESFGVSLLRTEKPLSDWNFFERPPAQQYAFVQIESNWDRFSINMSFTLILLKNTRWEHQQVWETGIHHGWKRLGKLGRDEVFDALDRLLDEFLKAYVRANREPKA